MCDIHVSLIEDIPEIEDESNEPDEAETPIETLALKSKNKKETGTETRTTNRTTTTSTNTKEAAQKC